MKKIFVIATVVAAVCATMSCGGSFGKNGAVDSLSYAVGADLGLNLNFGMGDLNLDNDVVLESVEEFYANGDLKGEELMQLRNRMMEFQYTRMMPFMNAKRSNEMVQTDCPDTLPALPELYDENFTREDVSRMIGTNMGAWVKSLETELDMDILKRAVNDGLGLESQEHIDSLMLLTQEQMQATFRAFSERKQAEAEAEHKRLAEENAKASAEWLAEIEKQEGVQKTESGLLYRIDREGDGVKATNDADVVNVNYEGKTRNGNIFDSSYERGEAIEFPLNRVIAGWTEGMKLVSVGGQITLWIPAEMAYGERGAGEDIGPNEALEFKVELLGVTPAPAEEE